MLAQRILFVPLRDLIRGEKSSDAAILLSIIFRIEQTWIDVPDQPVGQFLPAYERIMQADIGDAKIADYAEANGAILVSKDEIS